jgi:glycosyltransferase involved in cell wall biosynthesis
MVSSNVQDGPIRSPRQPDSVENQHVVFTIVSPSYFSRACVLAAGVKEFMPDTCFRILVLQSESSPRAAEARLNLGLGKGEFDHTVMTMDQIDWEEFDVVAAALFYEILEFATSIKPGVLRHFLKAGAKRVTYMDPDIQVFNDFTSLLDDSADVSLTPHFLTEIPDDGLKPSKREILLAGFYNLGFCSVRPSGLPFLNWWATELQFGALVDFGAGYFTDQRIMDFVALHANLQILSDPGLNVAFWNLHERSVVSADDNWKVLANGEVTPLYFFHFSGFRLSGTTTLSVHATRSVIGTKLPWKFAHHYEELVKDGNRKMGLANESDPFVSFTSVPKVWRNAIRMEFNLHLRAGLTFSEIRALFLTSDVSPSGFGTSFNSLLEGWTTRPGVNGIPRGIAAFFSTDLISFSLAPWAQIEWANAHLGEMIRTRKTLSQAILTSTKKMVETTAPVVVVGFFCYEAAVGALARDAIALYDEKELPVAIDVVEVGSTSDELRSHYLRRKSYLASRSASVLAIVNADVWFEQMINKNRIKEEQFVEAVWAWELEKIPESMLRAAAVGKIDRISALSQWSAQSMSEAIGEPVGIFNAFPGVLKTRDDSPRFSVTPSNAPYILSTFDAKSLLGRKNPDGVLAAWREISPQWPEHYLVLKSTDFHVHAPPKLHSLIEQSPRTILIDQRLSQEDYNALLGAASAYVSLHRSEGLGLTMVEAALAERPTVYTNYSGIAEIFEGSHFPVQYELVKVGESGYDNGPYDNDASWAQPNLSAAAQKLSEALVASQNREIDRYKQFRKPIEEVLLARNEQALEKYHELAKISHQRIKKDVRHSERELGGIWWLVYPFIRTAMVMYFLLPKETRRNIHLVLRNAKSRLGKFKD